MEIRTRRNLILTILSTLTGWGTIVSFLNLPATLDLNDTRTGLVFVILFLLLIFFFSTALLIIRLWSGEK